jgi:MFS transporter, OFA family, oxalate/formate antiporter
MTSLFGMPRERGRWVFVALGLVINLWLGTIYAWSIFVEPLTAHFAGDLGLPVTAGDVLMPFSVYLVCIALVMPFTGRIIETLGPRNGAIAGGVLVGLGWLLASVSTSVPMLSVTYGVVGGIGEGLAYSVLVAVAACWFPDRRGLAVGITILGIGFSTFFTAHLADYLVGAFGVMNAFRVLGVAVLILIPLLALPLRFPSPGWVPAGWTAPGAKPGEEGRCECNRARMLRSPSFYGLWACYFIGCLAGLMAISITTPVGAEVGAGAGLATFLMGFFAIFNGFGRPFFGALTDRVTPRTTAIGSFVLIAAASLLMWQVPTVPAYILSFAVLWGCLGGWLAIAPTATGSYYGTCDYPRCYGVVFLAYGAGAIAGPQLAGSVRTATGSYVGVFPVVLGLALVGILLALALLRPPASGPCSKGR